MMTRLRRQTGGEMEEQLGLLDEPGEETPRGKKTRRKSKKAKTSEEKAQERGRSRKRLCAHPEFLRYPLFALSTGKPGAQRKWSHESSERVIEFQSTSSTEGEATVFDLDIFMVCLTVLAERNALVEEGELELHDDRRWNEIDVRVDDVMEIANRSRGGRSADEIAAALRRL